VIEKDVSPSTLQLTSLVHIPIAAVSISKRVFISFAAFLILLLVLERLPIKPRRKPADCAGFEPGPAPNAAILMEVYATLKIRRSLWGGLRPSRRHAWFWSALGTTLLGALGPLLFRSGPYSDALETTGDVLFLLGGLFLIPPAFAFTVSVWACLYVLPRQ